MTDTWTLFVDTVSRAVLNPGANPAIAAFVLSAFVILLLIMVLGLLLVVTPRHKRVIKRRIRREIPGAESAEDSYDVAEALAVARESTAPKPVRKRRLPELPGWVTDRRTTVITIVVLVLVAFISGYYLTGTDDYCARTCHAESAHVIDALEIGHSSCTACHEQPGLAGLATNTVARAEMGIASLSGGSPDGVVVVSSASCLRCHRDVLDAVVESPRGIRMSHAEPVESGMTCTSCHEQTGHSERRVYSMSTCLRCHGGGEASAECETCHSTDPYDLTPADVSAESSRTIGSGDVLYPVVKIGDIGCGGCHDEANQCDTCHGLRMPHSKAFVDGGHARAGAFEAKEMCFRCHDSIENCESGCHIGWPGHAPGWKQEHKTAPRDSGCVCHAQRFGRTEPMCTLCH